MYIVYFLCILLFGSFYLINLVLAVVAISYEQEVLGPGGEKGVSKFHTYFHYNLHDRKWFA